MATRQDIVRDIKQSYGPMLNMREVGEYTGLCQTKLRSFLKELTAYDTGKDKKYLALDIAGLLVSHQV